MNRNPNLVLRSASRFTEMTLYLVAGRRKMIGEMIQGKKLVNGSMYN